MYPLQVANINIKQIILQRDVANKHSFILDTKQFKQHKLVDFDSDYQDDVGGNEIKGLDVYKTQD